MNKFAGVIFNKNIKIFKKKITTFIKYLGFMV